MKTFRLVNPLKDKERLQVSRLLGHDLNGFLSAAYCATNLCERKKDFSYLEKRVKPILIHIGQISSIVSDLSLLEEFNLSSNVEEDYFSRELLRSSIERISVLNKTKLNYEISKNIPDKFLTEQNCLYGVLFNLIKNAVEHGKENDINVNVDFQDSYPDKIIFQPKGSENYNKFVGFHISNKG